MESTSGSFLVFQKAAYTCYCCIYKEAHTSPAIQNQTNYNLVVFCSRVDFLFQNMEDSE